MLGCFSIHLNEAPFKHKLVLSDARHYSAVLDPAELPPSPTSPSTAPQEKMAQTEQLIFECCQGNVTATARHAQRQTLTATHAFAPCTDLKFVCATQDWHSWGQQGQQHMQGSGSHSSRPRALFATWDLVQLPSLLSSTPVCFHHPPCVLFS